MNTAGSWRRIAAVLLTSAVLAGCGGDGGGESADGEESFDGTYLVGYTKPLTGTEVEPSSGVYNGAVLAMEQANAAGGALGKKIELVVEDDACDAQTAANAMNRLVSREVQAVTGGWCSGAAQVQLPIASRAGIPFVLGGPNSETLVTGEFDNVAQVPGNNVNEAITLAWLAAEEAGGRQVAVVDDQSDFGKNIASRTIERLADYPDVGVVRQSVSAETRDFSALISALQSEGVDTVIWTGYYSQAAILVQQASSRGFDVDFVMGDGAVQDVFIEAAGDTAEGVYGSTLPGTYFVETSDDFIEAYTERFGRNPDNYAVMGYDAMRVLLAAVEAAGDTDPAAVIEELHGVRMDGASGPIEFDDTGARQGLAYPALVVRDGEWARTEEQPPAPESS